jgi:YrbI family 3-deoxy-D-manno-octulosonate 8-phosphate phosphatase
LTYSDDASIHVKVQNVAVGSVRLAIIPARGGSKRIPHKNVLPIAGVPLIAHSVRHARNARLVDAVIVSTDDHTIAEIAANEGAIVVQRPAALASDTATSESALLHVLETRASEGLADPDLVVFLQCTSPIRSDNDIDTAIETLEREGADSLLSVCDNTRFVWTKGPEGPRSVNYDFHHRRREQDLDPQFQENGSIYLSRPALLRATGNRLGGKIALHVMDYWSSFQIDSPEDAELCEWIMSRRASPAPQWPQDIGLIVFDFDGVMTDNRVYVDQDGRESVACSRGDGYGLEKLRNAGIPMLVLSKERNPVVAARCRKLQLECAQGIDGKAAYLARVLSERQISAGSVLYVGNDENDIEAMNAVGLPVAVADAHPAARRVAKLVLHSTGGHGAVRELCDEVLRRTGREKRER